MTWRFKLQGTLFATVVLGTLALAAAANWTDLGDFLAWLF